MTAAAEPKDALSLDVRTSTPETAVAALIDHAATAGASDLFFCADEHEVGVLVRHLGLLRPVCRLTGDHGRRCMSHIKAMAGMDIAEKRRPLDGRWLMARPDKSTLDLRISTIPTMYGEDFTLRLLDRESRLLGLEQLGLVRRDFNQLMALLHNPSGLIVVTGPTGSGKTTTLYGCLRHLNTGDRKINTIEDPIEYAVEGIRQSQVNPRLEVGFAELLRSALRQAPDVIMIGEMRDPETAETAVRAANSGHLVLATLHAPVAAGAIDEPAGPGRPAGFSGQVAAGRRVAAPGPHALHGVQDGLRHQRHAALVRRGQALSGAGSERTAVRPQGLPGLPHVGVFRPLGRVRGADRQPGDPAADPGQGRRCRCCTARRVEEGMLPFRLAALLKVAQGQTSIEEVFRAIPMEYLGEG